MAQYVNPINTDQDLMTQMIVSSLSFCTVPDISSTIPLNDSSYINTYNRFIKIPVHIESFWNTSYQLSENVIEN